MKLCNECLMPDTRPRIEFTGDTCNACLWSRQKQDIDWTHRKHQFMELLAKYANLGPVAPYDCIIPFSGGKDSAAIAWRLRHEYKVRPLLVCYGQLLWTEYGRHNLNAVCNDGFDILYWRVSQDVSRKLARRFMVERGHPKQHYDAGVNSVPVRCAVALGIPLVVYAEHGESEYGGLVLSEDHRRSRDLTEVLEHQVGDHPLNWAVDGISEGDLFPYVYPDEAENIEAVYFSYYHSWDTLQNVEICRRNFGFKFPERSEGTFTNYDSIDDMIDDLDFYMMWPKFGFGRATRDANRLIQQGEMTREQGKLLARQYDGEFPYKYLPDVLRYLKMDTKELDLAIDRHRNPALWKREGTEWRKTFGPSNSSP